MTDTPQIETPERQETLDRLRDLPTTILTPRLTIEPVKPSDAAQLADAMVETWEDLRQSTTQAMYPVDKCVQKESGDVLGRLEAFQLRTGFYMAARPHDDDKIASFVTLHDVSEDARRMQATFWTRKSFAEQGLTTEAMSGLLHWAYKEVGATMITARCHDGDEASEHILTKLGFEFIRVSEEPIITPDDRQVHERRFMHSRSNLPALDLAFGR